MSRMIHKSVLLQETIDGLEIRDGDIVVDGTLGGGGHSEEILKRTSGNVTLIAMDADADAISGSKLRLEPYREKFGTKIFFVEENFRNMDKAVAALGFDHVDKVLLDIGLSSNQLEESGRGFSFQKKETLDMSFSKSAEKARSALSAFEIVNSFEEENLADVIYGYGEEKFSRKIAKAIVEERELGPINDTEHLASIIGRAVPFWYRKGKIHPATKTFQAIRIAVNDELEALKMGLGRGFELLNPQGRMAVISFHSLEDRIVKNFFKDLASEGKAILITKKPTAPTKEEIKENPRSRSAKLRVMAKN